jgi:FkbM family methyltransferase
VLRLVEAKIVDSTEIYFESNGILKYKQNQNGEYWFIRFVLEPLLADIKSPVALDIGANVGNYSQCLAGIIPKCQIYALEPNPIAYELLNNNLKHLKQITCLNIGASSCATASTLYVKNNQLSSSELATLYPDSLSVLRGYDSLFPIEAQFNSIDNLQKDATLPSYGINFIKIDTEGHELDCFRGATNSLSDRSLRIVQFEFNDINILSRTFLKDFYDILYPKFHLFRLDTNRLISLDSYDTSHEIFKYQNIVAIREEFISLVPR